MRVLHYYKTYAPDTIGGVEMVIGNLARGTARYGVKTSVLSLSRTPKQSSIFIDGHLAQKAKMDLEVASTAFSLSVTSTFAKMARDADVVHYHFPWPMMDISHFVARVQKPTLVTYHSDIVRQKHLAVFYRPLMHAFLSSVTAIVATSPHYLASSPVLQRYKHKTQVIEIGVDDRAAQPASEERVAFWKSRLGEKFFLFVGALRYYKGLQFLLDAAEATHLPVVIAGEGELSDFVHAEIKRRKLKNVRVIGVVSEEDKAALLSAAFAFVFPSHLRSEAFGLALLEAAEFSCPMVSCDIGTGTSYINIHGETGLVVPPADSVALAGAMQQLWAAPEQAARMGQNARMRYAQIFTADAMSAKYAALYSALAQ